ncbi:imm11 family protein [Paenibacillus humicus]|uniref:imm11 family protein n=1 Tax=Paenibacillus humicus TaxID=412861 RepID=UPI003D2E31E5
MKPYYLLTEDHRVMHRVTLTGKEVTEPFHSLPPISVISVSNTTPQQYMDWFIKPRPIISDDMKNILAMYQPHMECKRIDLVDHQQRSQYTYWAFTPPTLDCLSSDAEFYPDGRLKKLVLNREKIKRDHFFTILGIMEPYHVISLDAAESLLRRGLNGFILEDAMISDGGTHESTLG